MYRSIRAVVVALAIVGAAPLAAQTTTQRVHGTIKTIDTTSLTVLEADGSTATIALASDFRIIGMSAAKLEDIKLGDFVGVGSVPMKDGKQGAVEVTIFPPAMAGTGEGSRRWDVEPQGTMTNATVQTVVSATGDHSLTLKYKGGVQTVVIPDGTPIVALGAATAADLVVGAAVSVRATVGADKGLSAKAVVVGLNGLVPPI